MRRHWILLAVLPLLACQNATDVEIAFAGVVGGEPAACGSTYGEVGTTSSDLELSDFRLYVHEVRVITADGDDIPVVLEEDGVWQQANVALLDFEDGSGGCESGTPGMNTTLRGRVDHPGPFVGVAFRLGVPFDLNHQDASTARAPLNVVSMFWNWNGGYKFMRVDGRTTGQPGGWRLHLGSTGCEGDGRGDVSGCTSENRPQVTVDGFDPTRRTIEVDLGRLLATSDVDTDLGGQPGCISGIDDMDCGPIFQALGLPFMDTPAGHQQLFHLGPER